MVPTRLPRSAGTQDGRGLRAWAARSVLNRLTAISLGTSLLLLALVALVAFPLFYHQERLNIASRQQHKLDQANDWLRFRMSTLLESLDQLVGNSFVVNAFVDSTGRELYLLPILRDYRPPAGLAQTLVLLDSNLKVFGQTGREARLTPAESSLAQTALLKGKTQLSYQHTDGALRLLIAVPVLYPPASTYEGVLLSGIDAQTLLQPALNRLGPGDCLTISLGPQVLLSTTCNALEVAHRVEMVSQLASRADGDVALTLTFADAQGTTFRVLTLIAVVYGVLSLLALGLVFAATRVMGRPFSGKLEELAQAAQSLAADPNSTIRATWDHPDEIGHLTVAFDTMVEKWREIQASLELRVQQRTEQLQGALLQAHESSRAKSDFLAVMSHEIRTPMNGVVGMIQVLEMTRLDDEQRRQLQIVRGSSDLLLRVIDDLLDFSKVEAGKLSLDLAPMQMDRLLHEVVATLQPAAAARELVLQVPAMPVLASVTVSGDAVRLRQVLTNLLHNAIKFTGHGGVVRAEVACEARGAAIDFHIEVHDSGIGITADQLQRIFEPFEQAERSTTRRYGGTGLGLAIVKRLVNLMGGSIAVDSRPGVGSRFVLRLAMARTAPEVETVVAEDDPQADLSPLRVLLAEDNPTNQIVATAQLRSIGIEQVTLAEDGVQALQAATGQHFDLILMDIHMPRMDGCDATRALRRAGVATPVIAMTANVLPAERLAYQDAGMQDCLAKPINLVQLRSLIRRHCPAMSPATAT
jgi:two-component system, sensor histidine kinase